MPRLLATSDAPYAMQPLAPAESRRRGWTANRLPTSRHPWPRPSKSFSGSSAASIDVCDEITCAPDCARCRGP
jgi:hypothetical protein